MAAIQITVGALTSTKTVDNVKAQDIFDKYVLATRPEGSSGLSNQQKLDWVRDQIIKHVVAIAREQHKRVRRNEEESGILAESEALNLD